MSYRASPGCPGSTASIPPPALHSTSHSSPPPRSSAPPADDDPQATPAAPAFLPIVSSSIPALLPASPRPTTSSATSQSPHTAPQVVEADSPAPPDTLHTRPRTPG